MEKLEYYINRINSFTTLQEGWYDSTYEQVMGEKISKRAIDKALEFVTTIYNDGYKIYPTIDGGILIEHPVIMFDVNFLSNGYVVIFYYLNEIATEKKFKNIDQEFKDYFLYAKLACST